MAPADVGPRLRVSVVYSPRAGAVEEVMVTAASGATVADAIAASGLPARHGPELGAHSVGIWGQRCEPSQVLRDGDRVEIYRPLLIDPKDARRLRHRRLLAARQRPGRCGPHRDNRLCSRMRCRRTTTCSRWR